MLSMAGSLDVHGIKSAPGIASQFQAVKLSITDNISVSANVRQQYLKINQRTYLFHTPASRQGGAYETQSLLREERYPH
jgi:hypothetical protein